MAKFLRKDAAGVQQLVDAIDVASTPQSLDAGKIIQLDSNGFIPSVFIPPSSSDIVGDDVVVSNGVTLAPGDFVAVDGTGEVILADNTALATAAIGFVRDAVVGDGILTVDIYKGTNDLVTATVNTMYFLGTAGGITTTPPAFVVGTICQELGKSITANSVEFEYNVVTEYAVQ